MNEFGDLIYRIQQIIDQARLLLAVVPLEIILALVLMLLLFKLLPYLLELLILPVELLELLGRGLWYLLMSLYMALTVLLVFVYTVLAACVRATFIASLWAGKLMIEYMQAKPGSILLSVITSLFPYQKDINIFTQLVCDWQKERNDEQMKQNGMKRIIAVCWVNIRYYWAFYKTFVLRIPNLVIAIALGKKKEKNISD